MNAVFHTIALFSKLNMYDMLLVTDSRGKGLEDKIMKVLADRHYNMITMKVEVLKGATCTEAIPSILGILTSKKYDMLIIMLGVCDLSTIHWKEDKVSQYHLTSMKWALQCRSWSTGTRPYSGL